MTTVRPNRRQRLAHSRQETRTERHGPGALSSLEAARPLRVSRPGIRVVSCIARLPMADVRFLSVLLAVVHPPGRCPAAIAGLGS